MNMVQVGVIGVIGALFAIQFQSAKKEYGIYISVAVSILIFLCIVEKLGTIAETVKGISRYIRVESTYVTTLIKILGLTYISEFASSICKDTGHGTLATQIEMFGKITIIVLSLPILLALLKTIDTFLS